MKIKHIAVAAAAALTLLSSAWAAELKVSCTPVPHGDILRLIVPDMKEAGYDLKIIEFSDFVSPNLALDAGDVVVNYYQHLPFLENAVQQRGLKIASVGPVHILPMAIYSKKIKDIKEVKNGSSVTIPNDPSNGGRALLLLQTAGLIKLKDGAGTTATVLDIKENPKKLKIREVEAAQVPRTLDDVDFAVVNANYALGVGLNPIKDSFFIEGGESPYAVVVAARKGHENDPEIQALYKALRTEKVKKFMLDNYKGGVIPVF